MPEKSITICDVCQKGSYDNKGMDAKEQGTLGYAARICYSPEGKKPGEFEQSRVVILCRKCWNKIKALVVESQ